jgi:hypothetical protein
MILCDLAIQLRLERVIALVDLHRIFYTLKKNLTG